MAITQKSEILDKVFSHNNKVKEQVEQDVKTICENYEMGLITLATKYAKLQEVYTKARTNVIDATY